MFCEAVTDTLKYVLYTNIGYELIMTDEFIKQAEVG